MAAPGGVLGFLVTGQTLLAINFFHSALCYVCTLLISGENSGEIYVPFSMILCLHNCSKQGSHSISEGLIFKRFRGEGGCMPHDPPKYCGVPSAANFGPLETAQLLFGSHPCIKSF